MTLFASTEPSGIDLVRELPCTSQLEEQAIEKTLRRFPMTAESYGVFRNIYAPRPQYFLESGLPEWWAFRPGDDWHAAQAFIVEMARMHETTGRTSQQEIIATTSQMMYDLTKMMRGMRKPFPATAFLELADRLNKEPVSDANAFALAYDAARLVQVLDKPLIAADPPLRDAEACRAWVKEFRAWLREHRGELETAAVLERDEIEKARARMRAVSLCLR